MTKENKLDSVQHIDECTKSFILRSATTARQHRVPQCPATLEVMIMASQIAFQAHPRPLFQEFDLVELADEALRNSIGTGPSIVLADEENMPHSFLMPGEYCHPVLWLYETMRDRELLCRKYAYGESQLRVAQLTKKQKEAILRRFRFQLRQQVVRDRDVGAQIPKNAVEGDGTFSNGI